MVLLTLPLPQVFVLDRLLEEDGMTGDAYGPYDPEFVAEERQRVAREKVLFHTPYSCLCLCPRSLAVRLPAQVWR